MSVYQPSSAAGGLASLWDELDDQAIFVLGDSPLRERLKQDHGRKEIRLGKIFGHGDSDGASTSIERFKGDLHRELQSCQELVAEGMDLLVLCRNGESASSHQHALDDHGIDGTVEEGRLSAGWRDQEMGLVVVHDFEWHIDNQTGVRPARELAAVASPP